MTKKQALEKEKTTQKNRLDKLYTRICGNIKQARNHVAYTINAQMVEAYWKIGKEIVQEEQNGQDRAQYGAEILSGVSARLSKNFGRGFSVSSLKYMRLFYLTYPIGHALRDEFKEIPNFNINLSWTHYRTLCKVKSDKARSFYEIEADKNRWSARELERQIATLLFDRLAKSKDKKGVLNLAYQGQEISIAADVMKDPVVLEFLDLPESHILVESQLEEALISNLQKFLLELGKGFAFVSRQQRLTLEADHFYVDLVFYHTILKCYILIDIKVAKLSHGDLGQMLTYVNYYDKECLNEDDNPTIGLILCTEKNDAVVQYALGEKASQIFASKYQFHLPTVDQLQDELKKEVKMIKNQMADPD